MFRILTSIILIVIAGLVGFLSIKPLYSESILSLKYKKEINDSLLKDKEIKKVVTSLRVDISSIPQSDFDKLDVILPESVDKVRLLNDLNALAFRHGISFDKLKIGEEKGVNTLGKKKNITPNSLTVSFSAASPSYDNFKLFLEDIERSMKLIDINSISISTIDENTLNPNGSYSYEGNITTYWME